jgi:CDP-diacylglycerol--glycerol-3-phosphate 3-phosphatidyltransferase
MPDLAALRKVVAQRITTPFLSALSRSRLKPNTLTWLGLVVSLAAAYTIATDHLIVAGILVLLSGLCDILDGALARATNQSTRFGAILDSTFDRVADAVLLLGVAYLYLKSGNELNTVLAFLALMGSFLTSYVRARAEGLGIACPVGLFTRAERVIILALGLFLDQLFVALVVLAILAFFTAGQRLVYVWQKTKGSGGP